MGDTSEEEYYSAPETEEDDPPTGETSNQEVERLASLSLSKDSPKQTQDTEPLDKNAPSTEATNTNEELTSSTNKNGRTLDSPSPDETVKDDKDNDVKAAQTSSSEDDSCESAKVKEQVDKKAEFVSGLDNRFVSDDHDVLEGDKVELSEEQIKELKEEANKLKADGNTHFKNGAYVEAIESYSEALKLYPPTLCDHEIAVCYANRAACHMKQDNHQGVIDDCTHTLEIEPTYLKAILRRAQASEALEKYEEALVDYHKALEIDPSQSAAKQAVGYLPDKIKEQNEKLKEEMLGKLKELGNAILSPFGLSTNNFQLQQDTQTGSYSVNFQR